MKRRVVIVGGGTGGTVVANLLARGDPDLEVTMVSSDAFHFYQPGLLYVPFGWVRPEALLRPQRSLLHPRVQFIQGTVRSVDPGRKSVDLGERALSADTLVLATGARLAPEDVPGLEGAHHFYTPEAALRLGKALEEFRGGHIVVGVAGVPYKCPPAPLEFTLLLEWVLRQTGRRKATRITYISPLPRAFPIESVADVVEPIMEHRGIELVPFFNVEQVDPGRRVVTSLEGEEIGYDLLVLIPPHRGTVPVTVDGIADRGGWIRTDRETLEVKGYEGVFAVGDATDLPVSKSGSAAHYQAQTVARRILSSSNGAIPRYTGKVMCFLETGENRATLLRFDYNHPPRPAAPNLVAFTLKRLFNRVYWYLVPTGRV
ncbi:MAG: FAD/NAD(P)-binding oxidoreductase [Armatimonadota bacterium]|nr:FAD/NAD(P)-binding oxidoreductase [Armatimonadota bacterium]MDR5703143.1 FAD/NAD(P)-binding oxidoreductase [Armatimonadota bacterium]